MADAGVLVSSAPRKLAPTVAARIPAAADAAVARVSSGDFGVGRAGLAVAAAALGAILLYTVARPLVLGRVAVGETRSPAGAVLDAFLGDLRLSALVVTWLAVRGAGRRHPRTARRRRSAGC